MTFDVIGTTMKLDPKKTALLTLDFQMGILENVQP